MLLLLETKTTVFHSCIHLAVHSLYDQLLPTSLAFFATTPQHGEKLETFSGALQARVLCGTPHNPRQSMR